MKINTKITGFLVIGFFLISVFLGLTSIVTLLNSQRDNLKVFKNEFLETNRELIQQSAALFFRLLDKRIQEDLPMSIQDILKSIRDIDPLYSRNTVVMDIRQRYFFKGYDRPEMVALLDENTINRYLNESVLTRNKDFYLDNYGKYLAGKGGLITPTGVYFRIYDSYGLIVGYGKTLEAGKVRIEFVKKRNAEYFKLHFLISLIIYAAATIFAVLLSVYFMRHFFIAPLRQIGDGVNRVAKGKLDVRINIRSKDEIGDLASAFNQMTQDLQRTTTSIDNLNKEVTVRKKVEEELRNAYEQLKTTMAQLAQSAKMASVGLLAGGVAHEINNPLTGVLNNVQLIRMIQEQKKEFNIADFNELLNVIEESALRCKSITRSLLDFSRVSTRVIQTLSLNDVVEKSCLLITYEMQLQNIHIRKELQANLPFISGNPQLLQQVIFDIISNAKWAIQEKSEKEGGVITIKTAYDKDIKQAVLSIADTGIGISKENIGRIFEPFFTTKTIGEGTGLGLSIVYSIIKEHKGTIEVESQPNQGATFKITLPTV